MQINNTVVDNIKLDSFELGPVSVNFSELPNMRFSVILGMNVIKEFNTIFDFNNKKILMEPNFDINSKIPVDMFIKNKSRFGIWAIEAYD